MNTFLFKAAAGAACLMAFASAMVAGQTHTWSQSDFSDFEKGNLKNLSLRSDGLLTLAPHSHELFDTSSAYLWALAQDSKGNLYAGGGTGAKLYRIGSDGKGKMMADLDALEIHAIAVDSKDRVYAATSPDGKVYRITGNNKPEIFFDPKAKYIWSLAFDKKGNLFIATGDQGEIFRVTPDGKGKLFFKSDETHVRSMALDSNDDLIVGTEPGGLVLRVSPAGDGFVLYQMAKKEITAVAVAADGSIYAAGVGNKGPGGALSPPPPAPAPMATVQVSTPGSPGPPQPRPSTPPPASVTAGGVNGGSEVWRIESNGNPRRMWSNAQDVVYAVVFDSSGHLLVGAGNRGNLYRIESPTMYTALLTVPATQMTAFQQGRDGKLYAATGNVGKVYEIGPAMEHEGAIESDVFDSSMYSLWGRVSFEGRLNGGQVAISTRSGNLDQPQKNWSPWSAAVTSAKGAPTTSPAARFVQWKATLTADSAGHSPELESVDVAYLPKNVEPHIDQIEITPPNYKFPASTSSLLSLVQPQQTLTLPPLGRHGSSPSFTPDSSGSSPSMQLSKGAIGARWAASDPNGDTMIYTVEIRGVNEKEWKLLKDKVTEKYFSWDSTAFPDGEYRLRIGASDLPSNPPADALSVKMESDPFVIDNTPPKISGLAATRSGNKLEVRWHAADALNNIAKAEYSLDGGDWTVVAPTTKLSDSMELDYMLSVDAAPGEHTLAVRVQDDYDNLATDKTVVR
jgi:sugar lactone lactonase YvrE